MKRAVSLAALLTASAIAAPASAHRVAAHVSKAGIEFVEQQIPSYIPESMDLPTMSRSFGCAELVQSDTTVHIDLHDIALTTPRDGVLRLELEVSVDAEGELFVDNPYACFGSETCRDALTLSNATAVVEFQIEVADGAPQVLIHDVELLVGDDDLEVRISECSLDGVANTVIGWAESLALDLILNVIEGLAADRMAPMIEDLIGGFASFEGHFGPTTMHASLLDARAGTEGLFVSADIGLVSGSQQPASCLPSDAPPPEANNALPPDLAGGVPGHVGVAINFGLLDDVLYNVWRVGLMCLSDNHFKAVGVDLELDYHLGKLLPGFPPDTKFSLEVRVMEPPQIRGSDAADAAITLVARGVEADLIGRYSGGSDVIRIVADVEASTRLGVDRDASALVLRPEGVRINRLEIDDTVGGEPLGIDEARLAQMLETHIVPKAAEELGAVPVSGSIVGFADHYVLLRDVFTTEAYLSAKVDLFRAPDDDTGIPTTAIESRPEGLVTAQNSVIRVTGSDPEIPSELLQYRVVVDGEERPLSFVRDVVVGKPGHTGTHEVELSAVDLAGNEDPNPILLKVDVDGKEPNVLIDGGRQRDVRGPTVSLSWRQSDDLTPSEDLVPRVLLYRVRDTANILDDELVAEFDLEPGQTAHDVPIGSATLYRVEVRARDEAGNEGVASMMLSQNTGGCAISSVAGGAHTGGSMLLVFVAAALGRIRRRRA